MGKVVLYVSVSLDGVMQGPGRPNEDRRGGFTHGGWGIPYADPVLMNVAGSSMSSTGALLLGRRTYEDFYAVWPNRPKPNPFTDVLNNTRKYVASRTLREPLPWMNSTLLAGDAESHVARLKTGPEDLVILGSGELARSLMRCRLIDSYILLIHPLVLGAGRRLFGDAGPRTALRLVDSKTSTTGVVVGIYEPVSDGEARR